MRTAESPEAEATETNREIRTREHLTEREVESLIEAAKAIVPFLPSHRLAYEAPNLRSCGSLPCGIG